MQGAFTPDERAPRGSLPMRGGSALDTNRLTLAQQAYQAALRAARAESTPRTWARLLRAARNLREASHDAGGAARRSRTRD